MITKIGTMYLGMYLKKYTPNWYVIYMCLLLINNDGLEIMQAILNPDMLFKFQ